jgi:hypothetical protein
MSFAADAATHAYYERRAREYDEWYHGAGVCAHRDRPGWHDEVERVAAVLSALCSGPCPGSQGSEAPP